MAEHTRERMKTLPEERIARREYIVELREEGLTFRLIGYILGLSRQRVQQIYKKYKGEYINNGKLKP